MQRFKYWDAEYLVGAITKAPTSYFFKETSGRVKISKIGIAKAIVFPLPVVASTQTSLFLRKRGIVVACTGVIWVNPKFEETTSNVFGDNLGSKVSNRKAEADISVLNAS